MNFAAGRGGRIFAGDFLSHGDQLPLGLGKPLNLTGVAASTAHVAQAAGVTHLPPGWTSVASQKKRDRAAPPPAVMSAAVMAGWLADVAAYVSGLQDKKNPQYQVCVCVCVCLCVCVCVSNAAIARHRFCTGV